MKTKRKRGGGACWTGNDHAQRDEQRQERQRQRLQKRARLQQKQQQPNDKHDNVKNQDDTTITITTTDPHQEQQQKRERRRATLTHETREKRDSLKLKLHITKTQREIELVKKRLMAWDPVVEEELEKQQKEAALAAAAAAASDGQKPKKRHIRNDPTTWKLKGAARPAWQVYDFDTRYVDPYIQAHKDAADKASRCVNLLAVHKGRLQNNNTTARTTTTTTMPPLMRNYLGLLMQLGHLSKEAKQYKLARTAWLECVDLEGETIAEPMSTARECLVRMYMGLDRLEAAVRLGERLTIQDKTVWVRYSLALASFCLKKDNTEEHMIDAIRANPFCAYYIAFYDTTFKSVMEYTEELEDAEEEPQSALEEAIEYCAKEAQRWSTSGAGEFLRDMVRQAWRGRYSQLSASDMEWAERLDKMEAEYDSSQDSGTEELHEETKEDDDEEEESKPLPDFKMYAGMFRTAMEMLESSGELIQASAVTINEAES